MSFADAVRNVLSNYANFNGRARRSEFWYWFLANFLLSLVLAIIGVIINTNILQLLAALALLVPNLSVGARRLHDTGKSGWLQLLAIIPLVGIILLIVWWATDGAPGDNQYGPNPKGGAVPGGYGQPGMPNPYAG